MVAANSPHGLSIDFSPKDDRKFAALCDKVENPQDVTSLCFYGASLTAAGLAPIRKFSRLQRLRLDNCWLGDGAAKHLGTLTDLRELALMNTTVIGDLPSSLSTLTKLRNLRLAYSWVTDATLQQMPVLSELEVLDVSGDRVTSGGLELLKKQPKLRELRLHGLYISSEAMTCLASLPKLQCLSLQEARCIEPKALAILATAPKLISIDLRRCSAIGDEALKHICKIDTLQFLSLDFTSVTDAGLAELSNLKNLTSLSVVGCRKVRGTSFGRLMTDTKLRIGHDGVHAAGGEIKFIAGTGSMKALQETPDGKVTIKVTGERNGGAVARLYDKAANKPFGSILYHPGLWKAIPITCWAFSPDGKYIVTGTGEGLREGGEFTSVGGIYVWNAKTGELVATGPDRVGYVKQVAFQADSKSVEYSALKFNIDGP